MTLEWRPFDKAEHCAVSSCGRYSVSEYNGGWHAWKLAPGGPWFAPIAQNLADETAARAKCQADAESA
jgi:hypothetical protein